MCARCSRVMIGIQFMSHCIYPPLFFNFDSVPLGKRTRHLHCTSSSLLTLSSIIKKFAYIEPARTLFLSSWLLRVFPVCLVIQMMRSSRQLQSRARLPWRVRHPKRTGVADKAHPPRGMPLCPLISFTHTCPTAIDCYTPCLFVCWPLSLVVWCFFYLLVKGPLSHSAPNGLPGYCCLAVSWFSFVGIWWMQNPLAMCKRHPRILPSNALIFVCIGMRCMQTFKFKVMFFFFSKT